MKNINKQKGSSDLGMIIIILIGLFLIWLIFGGAEKTGNQDMLLQNPIENTSIYQ